MKPSREGGPVGLVIFFGLLGHGSTSFRVLVNRVPESHPVLEGVDEDCGLQVQLEPV